MPLWNEEYFEESNIQEEGFPLTFSCLPSYYCHLFHTVDHRNWNSSSPQIMKLEPSSIQSAIKSRNKLRVLCKSWLSKKLVIPLVWYRLWNSQFTRGLASCLTGKNATKRVQEESWVIGLTGFYSLLLLSQPFCVQSLFFMGVNSSSNLSTGMNGVP